jgi:ubiquinone/menaquinone biosynthesis C-methylase UbiE
MLELENEPNTYDQQFTQLTKGINNLVFDWILTKIKDIKVDNHLPLRIADIGCGPGTLAKKVAQLGHNVIGLDANSAMIEHANRQIATTPIPKGGSLIFENGSATVFPESIGKLDIVTTTFMLSEMRTLRQNQFLQTTWNALKEGGRLFIAEEFIPNGLARIGFMIKRLWYTLKLRRKRTGITHPLKWLERAFTTGFRIIDQKIWQKGAIRVYELQKISDKNPINYRPAPRPFNDLQAKLSDIQCLWGGQIDSVAIEPGLYSIGNPTPESPVIVTANYILTYNRVMRSLLGQNCWVLCVDSNGINVWCAARGGEFGNSQLIEAVNTCHLEKIVSHRTLILPQLAAGGVSKRDLPASFHFSIVYGPIWAKDLPEFLEKRPKLKPSKMRLAQFTFPQRLEAGITHGMFLLRMGLFLPSILVAILLGILKLNTGWIWLVSIWLWTFGTAMGIAILYPMMKFTRRFIGKGLIFAGLNCLILSAIYMISEPRIFLMFPFRAVGSLFLVAWIAFFETMSFSGYTMETSLREIQAEYSHFQIIHKSLLWTAIILITIGLLLEWLPWV